MTMIIKTPQEQMYDNNRAIIALCLVVANGCINANKEIQSQLLYHEAAASDSIATKTALGDKIKYLHNKKEKLTKLMAEEINDLMTSEVPAMTETQLRAFQSILGQFITSKNPMRMVALCTMANSDEVDNMFNEKESQQAADVQTTQGDMRIVRDTEHPDSGEEGSMPVVQPQE